MMQKRRKICAVSIMAFYVLSMVLLAVPATSAATPAITLTPTSQAAGGSVSVAGTGFGATKAVGISFGAEVTATGETVSRTGSDMGPYNYTLANRPIKPGTFTLTIDVADGAVIIVITDNGNGTLVSTSQYFDSGTMDYAAGKFVCTFTASPGTYTVLNTASYTRYQYGVTPAAGVNTNASGSFTASITVPAVANGSYNVTAIDASGNRATSSLTVVGSTAGWSQTYGGSGNDAGTGETVQTSDGGYAVSGSTNSSGAGGLDFWLFKTDAAGVMLWNKTYGGVLNEVCDAMRRTSDGGYAMAGGTYSFGAGGQDIYLVKTDANGVMQWNKTYGGTDDEWTTSVIQTSDGGYSMFGFTKSFGAGLSDFYLVKTDAAGNMQWNKTYGGTGTENDGFSHVQCGDGGYVMSGSTTSFGAGSSDAWLFKTDANGNMLWNKTYGGTSLDAGLELVPTSDGGYAFTGVTNSFGGAKAWLVKTDASGVAQWNKTYSTLTADLGLHVIQTTDGGYAIVGWNYANGQDLTLYKTDATGNLQWSQTYGGTGVENGYALLQTSDEGYVLTGLTTSFGAGGRDVWLIKTDAFGVVPESLTFMMIMLLSSIAALIGTIYFRKPLRSAK